MNATLEAIKKKEATRAKQGDNATPVQENPTLKAIKEKQQALDTGKGLPEPAPVPFTAGSDFESDIQSVYLRGKSLNASPEEIANMIKAKYGDKYEIKSRKVSQQEKDDMWTPGLFVADEEYIVYDPQTEQALSLDNPGFSQSQALGAGSMIIKELPTAIATRGGSLGTKMLGMGATGSAVSAWDQSQIKKLGGKDEVNPWEVGLAGAFTAGGELFGPVLFAGTKLISGTYEGAKNFAGTLGRRLEISETKKRVSELTGTPEPKNYMTKDQAEEAMRQYQQGWTRSQRNKMAKQAQEQEKLYGQGLVSNLEDIKRTPAEKLGEIKRTPAEMLWNTTRNRVDQSPEAKEALQTEEYLRRNFPEYAEQLDRRLDDAAAIVDRAVANTSTVEGRELARQQKILHDNDPDYVDIQSRQSYLSDKVTDVEDNAPDINIDPQGWLKYWQDNKEYWKDKKELSRLNKILEAKEQESLAAIKEIDELKPAVQEPTMASTLSREELGESIIEGANIYHQSLKDRYKKAYKKVEEIFGDMTLSKGMVDKLIPEESIKDLTTDAQPIIDEFKKIMQERPTIGGGTIKPTILNIEEARKYLNGQIDKLYNKNNASFDPVLAEKLNNIRKQFDDNLDGFVTEKLPDGSEKQFMTVEELFKRENRKAREFFADYKTKFGDKDLLKKVVDEVNKGQKSVSQITNMLFNVSGQGKFGTKVTNTIMSDKALQNAIKDYVYATTFFENGNLLTGQRVTTKFNKVKKNKEIKRIFGNEWSDFVDKAEQLESLDVVRKEQARGSPTQPKQQDQQAWEMNRNKNKGFWERAFDMIGATKDSQTDAENKQLLKNYVLSTVYGANELPKLVDGKLIWGQRVATAALAQEEAEVAGDVIDTAIDSNEEETK